MGESLWTRGAGDLAVLPEAGPAHKGGAHHVGGRGREGVRVRWSDRGVCRGERPLDSRAMLLRTRLAVQMRLLDACVYAAVDEATCDPGGDASAAQSWPRSLFFLLS